LVSSERKPLCQNSEVRGGGEEKERFGTSTGFGTPGLGSGRIINLGKCYEEGARWGGATGLWASSLCTWGGGGGGEGENGEAGQFRRGKNKSWNASKIAFIRRKRDTVDDNSKAKSQRRTILAENKKRME